MSPKPKAVLISDIHYNINTLPLADASLCQAVAKANKLNIPIIIAGDLHDTKAILRGECIKAIIDTVHTCRTEVIVLTGNHDLINERSKEHSLEFLYHLVTLIKFPIYHQSLDLWFIPYQSDPRELEEILKGVPKGSTIIMHQGVQGAKMGEYVFDKSSLHKEEFADFRVISGHYHPRQDIKCGRPRRGHLGLFSYIGNPYTLSFAEANDPPKGFQILMDDGSLEFVPTNLRKHVIYEIDSHVLKFGVKYAFSNNHKAGDLVWLKVKGPYLDLQSLNKKEIGFKLFNNQDFRLDKIYTDAPQEQKNIQNLLEAEILDQVIDDTPESLENKTMLKALWREVHK